jgi:hypothetical protein
MCLAIFLSPVMMPPTNQKEAGYVCLSLSVDLAAMRICWSSLRLAHFIMVAMRFKAFGVLIVMSSRISAVGRNSSSKGIGEHSFFDTARLKTSLSN